MRWKSLSAPLVAALVCPPAVLAADGPDRLRVYPPGERPDDPRYAVHGVDQPADFTGRFADKAAWEDRAAFLRRQVAVANGLWPMPEKTPLKPVIHGKIDRDGYTVEKVYFASLPGHYVTGNLYRPTGAKGKRPAVLCPHGHWTNGRLMWTSDANAKKDVEAGGEQTTAGAHAPLQARCAMLARMGCVVFHYDMVGYADSNKLTHRKGMTDVESVLRLQSQMGLQTWNGVRAVDFVTGLDDVDPSRIAVTGASGGGSQSFVLAAVDPRVAVSIPAVMVSMNMQGGCVCENAPLLRVGTNNVELAGLIAPRPLAMTAANDWTQDVEIRGLPELKLVYKLLGQPDNVRAKHFPFPHNYNQVSREMMYDWVNTHFKLGHPGPVKEKPFEPVPPAELGVWDDAHPVPADAADNDAVRKTMTELSDKQLSDLASDLPAYRRTVKAALEAMLVSRYPGPAGVRVARHSGPWVAHSPILERGAVERVADGTKVPYVAIFQGLKSGTVVVWAHPEGKRAAFDGAGNATPELAALLKEEVTVVVPDLFWTGEFLSGGGNPASAPAGPTYAPKSNPPYAAFHLGYNRSVVGNRVHDLLAVIAMVRGWEGTTSVRVLGTGKAGPWAVLAKAAADDAVDKLAADLDQFDFDRVADANDPMLLPGALKYGGIYGLVPLCDNGESRLANARKAGRFALAAKTEGVTLSEEREVATALARWLVK